MKKKACFLPGGTQPKKTNYEGFRRNEVFLVANAVTAAEMLEFGEAYADQIIKNAKVLAKALSEKGLGVLCPKKGFTESHQVVVDSRDNGGSDAAGRILERAGIIVTKVPLPNDRGALNGLRIGTEEVTRLGMKTKDMEQAAEFFEKGLGEEGRSSYCEQRSGQIQRRFPESSFLLRSWNGRLQVLRDV